MSSPAVPLGGCASRLGGVAVFPLVMIPPRVAAVLLVTLLPAERRQGGRAASALGGERQDNVQEPIMLRDFLGKLVEVAYA